MEAYAAVLSYAIPGFVALIFIEYFASLIMKKPVNRAMDTISSLSSGMTNTLKDVIGLSVVIISYGWMAERFALFEFEASASMYVLAFILIDFASYWSHRWNHEINVFWNRHIVHHSSEEFNLSCALRQSVSGIIGVYFFLYIPMALIGVPPLVVAITAPLHLFAQFWYHTRLIHKMGFFEQIIVTPSHHRVHHAINPEYIDKNYSAIFILWDKWFGTFQEELADVSPVYGVKRQVKTWNPILINYQHMWLLFQDMWRTKNLWDKARLWFMPTGWRPQDVKNEYPVEIVEKPHEMVKYDTPTSSGLKLWAWFQLIFHNLLMYHMLVNIANLGYGDLLLYATFLFLSIFAYTSLMDRHPIAVIAEGAKFLFGAYIIAQVGGWYGLEGIIPGAAAIVGLYIIVSLGLTIYYTFFEGREPVVGEVFT